MTFSDKQVRALKAKLAHRHVKTRQSNGLTLAYVEGGMSLRKPTGFSGLRTGIGEP